MTRIHIAKFGQMCLKCFSLHVIHLIKRNAKTGITNKTARKKKKNHSKNESGSLIMNQKISSYDEEKKI